MGYRKGGSIGDVQDLVQNIGQVAQMPGGMEMLMTVAAEELGANGGETQQLRLYSIGGPVSYDGGGLAQAAQMTQAGGRGDDEMMLHLSPEEFDVIRGMWGEPEINPNTGIPEYGLLSKIWKGVKGVVKKIVKSPLFSFIAPAALNFFIPGAGAALGGALGLGKSAALVGNTLIRAGAGALGGGKEGALAGAVSGLTMGGAGAKLGAKFGLSGTAAKLAGDALIGGAGSTATGGDFATGALNQAMTSMIQPKLEAGIEKGLGTIFPRGGGEFEPEAGQMSLLPGASQMTPVDGQAPMEAFGYKPPGVLSRVGSWIKENPMLAATGAGMVAQGMRGPETLGGGAPPGLPPEFSEGIPEYDFNRPQLAGPADYYTYGQTGSAQPGEHQFFAGNVLPGAGGDGPLPGLGGPGGGAGGGPGGLPPIGPGGGAFADMLRRLREQGGAQFEGGGHARGRGSGRDDEIEAMLSDGEYVMDAETVALLGDGSNDAGARRLDELRERLRKHKGKGLAKGKFSADAKHPMQYLKEGGKVTKRTIEEVAYEVMNKHVKADKPAGHDVKKGIKHKMAGGGKVKRLYEVWDHKEKTRVGKPYNDKKRARTRADKLDNEYGAYRYVAREIKKIPEKKARGGRMRQQVTDSALVDAMTTEILGE